MSLEPNSEVIEGLKEISKIVRVDAFLRGEMYFDLPQEIKDKIIQADNWIKSL